MEEEQQEAVCDNNTKESVNNGDQFEFLYMCSECYKICQNLSALVSHTKWAHVNKLEHRCDYCKQLFPKKYNLSRHVETVHANSASKVTEVKCSLCDFCANTKKLVFAHYQSEHDITLSNKTVSFETFEEFTLWKRDFENITNSQFIKHLAARKRKSGSEILTYVCHRDGNFVPKGKNIRHMRVQGSNKINSHCPAKMTVEVSTEGVMVHYIDQHIGHELELGRMCLSESERQFIAEKLASKMSFQDILDEIRNSVLDEPLNRIHLIGRKDLWNIVKSFKISHEDGAQNEKVEVQGTLIDMEDNAEVTDAEETQEIVMNKDWFEEQKRNALDTVLQVHDMIENDQQLQAFVKNISSLKKCIQSLSDIASVKSQINPESPSRKTQPQSRFVSEIKKIKINSGVQNSYFKRETLALETLAELNEM